MKKIVATILIAILAITCLSAFVACDKTTDDSAEYGGAFVGAISKSTYNSVEDAVKAFLAEEISGEAFKAEYRAYAKRGELSQQEISKLAIDNEYKKNLVSVEKGEVEYSEQYSEEYALAGISDDALKRNVYVVLYKQNGLSSYRFYTPVEEVGQTLSKSAFNWFFHPSRYYNSTMIFEYGQDKTIARHNDKDVYQHQIYEDGKIMFDDYVVLKNDIAYEVYCDYCIDNNWHCEILDDSKIHSDWFLRIQVINYLLSYELCESSNYEEGMSPFEVEYRSCYERYSNLFVKTKDGYSQTSPIIRYNKMSGEIDYEINIKLKNNAILEIEYVEGDSLIGKISFTDIGSTKVDLIKEAKDALNKCLSKR